MTRQHTLGAVLIEQNQPLEVFELKLPGLAPGQVLVEMAYSGLCRTQLNEWRGAKGADPYLPHTLGHEGSGRVLALGTEVTRVRAGDPVVLSWIKGEGMEVPGTVYGSAHGPVNSGAISTFMHHTVVSENRLTPIPEEMPLREAALLGCAVATGGGIVRNKAKIGPGASVAVIGAGGIGMSAVITSLAEGAAPVIVVDIVREKLRMAKNFGAHHVLHGIEDNPLAAIRELTGGGVDFAIEAAGTVETMELAFNAIRGGGGLCVLAGNLPHGKRISIDPFDLIAGKQIVGTWGGETQPGRDIIHYAEMFLKGGFPLKELISREYQLGEINEAFHDLQQGEVLRSLFSLNPALG